MNTIAFGPAGALGDSTDGAGFLRALRRGALGRAPRRAVVLGAGGAARAVAAALAAEGVAVGVWSRDEVAARAIARDIAGVSVVNGDGLGDELGTAELLVSAVPVSAWTDGDAPVPPDIRLAGAPPTHSRWPITVLAKKRLSIPWWDKR